MERISQPKVISRFRYICSYPALIPKANIGEVWALSNPITELVFIFFSNYFFSQELLFKPDVSNQRSKIMSSHEL